MLLNSVSAAPVLIAFSSACFGYLLFLISIVKKSAMPVKFTDNSILPFGKYKGSKLANVPAWYLLNIYDAGITFGALKEYIEENKSVLEKQRKDNDSKNFNLLK